jgi:hypothetical protein
MADEPNQGATGDRPSGREHSARPSANGFDSAESPLSVDTMNDAFAERPEAFVGAAFAGGLALALLLRRLAR